MTIAPFSREDFSQNAGLRWLMEASRAPQRVPGRRRRWHSARDALTAAMMADMWELRGEALGEWGAWIREGTVADALDQLGEGLPARCYLAVGGHPALDEAAVWANLDSEWVGDDGVSIPFALGVVTNDAVEQMGDEVWVALAGKGVLEACVMGTRAVDAGRTTVVQRLWHMVEERDRHWGVESIWARVMVVLARSRDLSCQQYFELAARDPRTHANLAHNPAVPSAVLRRLVARAETFEAIERELYAHGHPLSGDARTLVGVLCEDGDAEVGLVVDTIRGVLHAD